MFLIVFGLGIPGATPCFVVMMRKAPRHFKETLPWNPWKEEKGAVYGSLESLPRSAQQETHSIRFSPKLFNGWVFLSVFGGGALSVFVVLGVFAMMVMKWTQTSAPSTYSSRSKTTQQASNQSVVEGSPVMVEDFKEIKGKVHKFFSMADLKQSKQPLVITERELNAILKHDTRLGVLHDTMSARIKDGKIQAIFDIKFGGLSLFGNSEGRLKGMGTFRVGLYADQLKVAVDSLKVNNSSMSKWMHFVHNMGMGDLVKSGMKKIANMPLRLVGKQGFQTTGALKPILATLDISKASTGNVFESMSFQGDGILNSLAEPVQLFAINELFDVHSRLRDLVNALDRVEVADGVITLYPKTTR
jgi:hypothetical protein